MSSAGSESFQSAAGYLSSAPSLSKVSNTIKLELYGLFKYVTVAKIPTTSRPSIFDMSGRAKWDAWAAMAKKYESQADAESRYQEIAKDLGWTEGLKLEIPQDHSNLSADGDIWLTEEESKSQRGGNTGFGTAVSIMAPPPKNEEQTIHGLALRNDMSGLEELCIRRPDADLNALDEYGYAPLHLACDRGHAGFVKALLERGADKSLKDPDGLTALELAQEAGHVDIEILLV